MVQGNRGRNVLVVLVMLAGGGCAGGPGLAALDSTESECAREYREYEAGPPVPSELSSEDRGRYEERTRDYHVSQQCQQAGTRMVRHAIPDVPQPRVP